MYEPCEERPADSDFASIADQGTVLTEVTTCDDCVETVPLSFGFPWLGQSTPFGIVTSIVVSSNGQINLDGSTDDNCCSADPIDGQLSGDRIAVAQEDLNPSSGGAIYVLDKQTSVIISYEDVPFYFSTGFVNVQVELYNDGAIEIRYGLGDTGGNNLLAAGLESSSTGFAAPLTDLTHPVFTGATGITNSWPENAGVRFDACLSSTAPTRAPANLATSAPSS